MANSLNGYMGKMLRVDLTSGKLSEERPEEAVLKQFLGGSGLGAHYLYQEVPPGVSWNSPDNRYIVASGPLGGTRVGGSGTISVVTKGPMTEGATSSQANGYLGAYLKSCGFDGIIIQGASPDLVYLYIHDGGYELRSAKHLAGKNTWETDDLIKKELGKAERECSVFSIGPAGENLVRFACLVGDRGHAAGHNGNGAVLGAKKLKAIAVARGKQVVNVADREAVSSLAKELFEKCAGSPEAPVYRTYKYGTAGDLGTCRGRLAKASLPIKNYTTNLFPAYDKFAWENFGASFEVKERPCWACRYHHCHIMTVKDGRHAGYVGEEPEYEQLAAFGPVIGNEDFIEAFVLSNEADRLGMDSNESGWLLGWLMECTEKGLLTSKDTDGIVMRWGDADAAKAMMGKVARREGVGAILAEGLKRGSERFSLAARSLAIYTKKGNTPRGHDHRNVWTMILDTCASNTGTDEAGSGMVKPKDVGLPADSDAFTPEVTAKMVTGIMFQMPMDDCLGMCRFNNRGGGLDLMARLVTAATGWQYTPDDLKAVGYRLVNLLRVFDLRHGPDPAMEAPSTRYGSAPIDGPNQGKTIAPVWREAIESYRRLLGWDPKTSRPLPETLNKLGLGALVKDIW